MHPRDLLDINNVYYDGNDAIWYDGSQGWPRCKKFFGGGEYDNSDDERHPIFPWNYVD